MEYKSCKLLLQVMLQQIEREIPHRGTDKELFRRFASYLKFNNIRKLIIDDIHSLSDRASIELFTLLLLLNKELDLKFICAGTKIPGLYYVVICRM